MAWTKNEICTVYSANIGDKEAKQKGVIMTVRESYEKIGSNFDEVLRRLGSEALVKRFALKFLNDTSFQDLKDALVKKDGETAFRAAHTLKGVCLNLGFDRLYEVSAELTEKLRGRDTSGTEEMFKKVETQYRILTDAIREMEQ